MVATETQHAEFRQATHRALSMLTAKKVYRAVLKFPARFSRREGEVALAHLDALLTDDDPDAVADAVAVSPRWLRLCQQRGLLTHESHKRLCRVSAWAVGWSPEQN